MKAFGCGVFRGLVSRGRRKEELSSCERLAEGDGLHYGCGDGCFAGFGRCDEDGKIAERDSDRRTGWASDCTGLRNIRFARTCLCLIT
jgi:hypothetical protein